VISPPRDTAATKFATTAGELLLPQRTTGATANNDANAAGKLMSPSRASATITLNDATAAGKFLSPSLTIVYQVNFRLILSFFKHELAFPVLDRPFLPLVCL
jgi:hypothetical protein